jgi:hypothetical protein
VDFDYLFGKAGVWKLQKQALLMHLGTPADKTIGLTLSHAARGFLALLHIPAKTLNPGLSFLAFKTFSSTAPKGMSGCRP